MGFILCLLRVLPRGRSVVSFYHCDSKQPKDGRVDFGSLFEVTSLSRLSSDFFGNTFSDLAEVCLPGDCRSSDVDAED